MQTTDEPVRIPVELEVARVREFKEDGFVQVWGYVGDYEVSVTLSLRDARVQRVRRRQCKR